MKKMFAIVATALLLIGAQSAMAEEALETEKPGKIPYIEYFNHLRVYGGYNHMIGGRLGQVTIDYNERGIDAPRIFDGGFNVGVEAGFRFEENYEFQAGVGIMYFQGDGVILNGDAGNRLGIEFDDLTIVPVYVGGKVLFTSEPDSGFVPYIRGDIGGVYVSGLDANLFFRSETGAFPDRDTTMEWWSSGFRFMYGLGGGVEYRTGKWGAFAEIMSMYFNTTQDAHQSYMSSVLVEADGSSWNPLNFRLGAAYHFK